MESMMQKLRSRSSIKKNEERWFLEHGNIFLKKLIAECNGNSIPIRSFSSSQLQKATNNFDSSLCFKHSWSHGEWYKVNIEDKPYLIKKFFSDLHGDAFNDMVLSVRMSNHSNFLKLVGCCFEFSSPIAMFEYEDHAFLSSEGRVVVNGKKYVLPWILRLKIAKEVAIAVTYLHTAFSRIIIHKAIKPINIFLDKHWNAKLTDFRLSVSLPEGKSRIEDEKIMGTIGYLDPLYIDTFSLSEYTDVYSFGVCLLVFLSGKSAYAFYEELKSYEDRQRIISYVKGLYENGKLDEVIDPMIAKDITSDQRLQVEAFVVLALKCCEWKEEDRPKMIQVAKELKRIQTSF